MSVERATDWAMKRPEEEEEEEEEKAEEEEEEEEEEDEGVCESAFTCS